MKDLHTPASSIKNGRLDHCIECSEFAADWVEWPCSREKLVRAAVESAKYLWQMDEDVRFWEAFKAGYDEGRATVLRRSLSEKVLKSVLKSLRWL